MEDKKPLLSICIPTYNRAEYLDKCIASIVSQKEFNSEDVELVISDNASDDNTEEVVKKYKNQYKNIFYSKNKENLADKNFPIVIGNAHGVFRKLCNDTLIFSSNSIYYMLETINKNIDKKPVLFFMSGFNGRMQEEYYIINSFDSFVRVVSYWATYIACFGIWEDDFDKLEDKFEGCSLQLWHTKVLFENIARKKESLIDNRQFFSVQTLQKKDLSYGLFEVFYKNYIGLCHKYLITQILSKSTFEHLREQLLFFFFLPWIVRIHNGYDKYILSSNKDIIKCIMNEYRKDTYYFKFYFRLKKIFFKRYIRKICVKIGLFKGV
jgi:glycosyltransferase involved in cell wall biosynthesis